MVQIPANRPVVREDREDLVYKTKREKYQAVVDDHPVWHDGRWGTATMEVVLAIMQSARERREIPMSHQVPSPD